MTDITIQLSKLVASRDNVRKTGSADGLEELAASIAAHGLLQSLVVRKTSHGKFAVIAGQRRLLALSLLAERESIPSDMPIACKLLSKEADAAEISLAENVVRVPMHPADQFEAFRALIDNGADVADVAARFGVTESLVAKRMKLGRVSPVLLTVYREGRMSLEQLQAFTVSDDHAAQERVWQEGTGYPNSIRAALTEGEIRRATGRCGSSASNLTNKQGEKSGAICSTQTTAATFSMPNCCKN
jgi:ParB family transcriptional regulator, chromosome partitioning protein